MGERELANFRLMDGGGFPLSSHVGKTLGINDGTFNMGVHLKIQFL